MIIEAATFLLASLAHLTVEWEPGAAGPEALIGVVMAVGAFFAFRGRWAVALGTSAFAAFGTIVGLTIISSGLGPKSVPDLTYHALILTTLIVSIVLMVRSRQALSRS
ncbi:hypothetical protein [Kutzneria sp. CA-103260]|uniref:hypothetical protein n=1 Tax=Kutzneria sp. CA-103260 TaxID=2802641 RepID=UPI001BA98012|nr:hypothetical protein [Kutzneria sp. CA-103260]QUQ69164.1 hypothetical protein JJ691_69180 [Kutzneria sp. CA-103260]